MQGKLLYCPPLPQPFTLRKTFYVAIQLCQYRCTESRDITLSVNTYSCTIPRFNNLANEAFEPIQRILVYRGMAGSKL